VMRDNIGGDRYTIMFEKQENDYRSRAFDEVEFRECKDED